MKTMKSMRFHRTGPPEVLVCDEVPRPVPAANEVLVRIEAAGINFADTIRRRGDPYPVASPLPFTLGSEAVGIVEDTGSNVSRQMIGQRVFAFPGGGCYSEYTVCPVDRIFSTPPTLPPVQSIALFVQGLTAALILKRSGRLQRGESVLVQGAAGGVGLLAVQLAKAFGAGQVFAAASTGERRQLAMDMGADVPVDYTQPDWSDRVRAETGGRGVDLVLEMTGGAVVRESMKLLAPFGRSIVYGSAGVEPLIVNTSELPVANHSVSGFYLRPYLADRALIAHSLQEMTDLIDAGRLKVHIGGEYPLDQAADAHRFFESRRATGKLVLVPQNRD